MAFADFDWATDTNYPAGSETWSATPTKVAPSAGVQADGFVPTDRPPAQWINWLFNGVITAGQALELRGLQEAWDQSEANGDTTPHIDVGTQDFVIGSGSGSAPQIFKVAHANSMTTVENLTVNDETHLDIATGIFFDGGTAAHRLLAKNASDQVVEYQGIAGAWTPSVSSVSGTGVVSGDVTSMSGHYIRLGQVVYFSLEFALDTTGWSGACVVEWDLPVSGSLTGTPIATVTTEELDATRFSYLRFGATGFSLQLTPAAAASGLDIAVTGSYLLA